MLVLIASKACSSGTGFGVHLAIKRVNHWNTHPLNVQRARHEHETMLTVVNASADLLIARQDANAHTATLPTLTSEAVPPRVVKFLMVI